MSNQVVKEYESVFIEMNNLCKEHANDRFNVFFPVFRNALWEMGSRCGVDGSTFYSMWTDYNKANNIKISR